MNSSDRAGRVFEAVVGQDRAVAQLRAAARAPVHAYLLTGPPGAGKRDAARAFAAALLCSEGGCGECDVCVRVAAEVHPDLVVVERQGPYITVAQAREIQRLAFRTPNERSRKVLVLSDFHLVREAAGTLLKVVEEPPASTVFVVLAEHVPPELVTIASRCVRIELVALGRDDLVAALAVEGVDPGTAAEVAEAAGGRLDRARLAGLVDRFDLDPSRPVGELSTGNRRKVGIVQAFVHAPELLVLDEPTSGLDPLLQHEFLTLMRETVASGATVFLSSHVLHEVERVADRVGILRGGHLVALVDVDELRRLARQRIDLAVSGAVDPRVFASVAGVVDVTVHDGLVRLVVEGSVDAVLKAAAALTVDRITTEQIDLEEIFLDYYREQGG